MDHGGEALIGLVVVCGNAAELLQVAEEVLDPMAPAIYRKVARNLTRTIGFGRDDSDPVPEAIPWELAGSSVNIQVR